MNMTGVSHLFIVPQLRSSNYLASLPEAVPSLRSVSSSGPRISATELPSLRSIVVANNLDSEADFREAMKNIPGAIDFREILRWNPPSAGTVNAEPLDRNDVMNIQFTRCESSSPKVYYLLG
jgi:hypothetical protein